MELIKEYLSQTNLVSHHIGPFNELLTHGLQQIINRELPIVGLNHTVTFGQVFVDRPKFINSCKNLVSMYPNHARKLNLTYDGIVYVNVTVNKVETCRVPIGKMPIMLKSSACNLSHVNDVTTKEECIHDPGGYFIINGKERVLVGQLRATYNQVYTFQCKPDDKFMYYSEIRSINDIGSSVLIRAFIDDKYACYLSLPNIKTLLPAGLVFNAMGVTCEEMLKNVRITNATVVTILKEQYHQCENAVDYISSILPTDDFNKADYVKTILEKELFYHVGHLTIDKSSRHLGHLLERLIKVSCGILSTDDKHNLANKRLDSSGNLVAFIFNGLFKQFVKAISTQLTEPKKLADPISIIKSLNIISYGMTSCFMASNWTTQKSQNVYSREGVSQVLNVQNYGSKLSHLRRIMLPNGVKGKNSSARLMHSSQFSFICPAETPEGERVGLVSNLSLTVDVTCNISTCEVLNIIKTIFDENIFTNRYLIIINGTIVGSCSDAYVFLSKFDKFRQSDLLHSWISVAWLRYADEIHIWSDEGRLVRPLLKVDVEYPKTFKDGIISNAIIFRDVLELEQCVIAMDKTDLKKFKCHYIEICPAATIMSVMASVIPFYNHSQSPRNAYQASMGKQAIGIPCETFPYRYDTTLHVLNYPQQPITRSEMVNVIKFNEMSHGASPIVAIMTFCGFNQEDSIILNKSSVDRGLFTSMKYITIVEEEKKHGNNDFESICLPKEEYRHHDVDYSHLSKNGIINQNTKTFLKVGMAIIGKTKSLMVKNPDGTRNLKTTDATVTIKTGEEGYLDSVLDATSDGIRLIKIRIRMYRIPEIGDKFASSTAQKGTCGMLFRQEDMPFDKDGIYPDLIINPHAIPSRMTINMLIEQCLNLVGCKTGVYQDATAFAHDDIMTCVEGKLKLAGFTDYKMQLYSGFTGEQFKCKTFIAPAYYQRLKHMVTDKIHARMAGPLDSLTHQPVAGRAREGGLRIGNMENDATIASGASRMVKEFMFDQSDKYELCVCPSCGQIPLNRSTCQNCNVDVMYKNTPYATKLFYQLLMGMGLKINIK